MLMGRYLPVSMA